MMNTDKKTKLNRIEWIDCAKGIGIILVILGHTYGISEWLYNLIYSFHMPLFFVLSGLTVKVPDKITKQTVKHLAVSYLKPYFIMAFTNLLFLSVWDAMLGNFSAVGLFRYIGGIFYCYARLEWMPNCSPLWFLPALFLCKLLFYVIVCYIPKKRQLICVLLCPAAAYVASLLHCPRLPWGLLSALTGLLFFYIGYVFRDFFVSEDKKAIRLSAVAVELILAIIISFTGCGTSMTENTYDNYILFLLSALCGTVCITELSKRIYKVKPISSFLGENTLVVIGFNYFARTFSTELFYLIPVLKNHRLTWWYSFILTSLVLCGLIIVQLLILRYVKKIKIQYKISKKERTSLI